MTEPARCRYEAAIVIPPGLAADGEVNVADIEGGKYALTRFVGPGAAIGRVYDRLFGEWLPQSGYQPDQRHIFERYRGESYDPVNCLFTCDVCVPVRPL